jgi:hypothetical protein
MNGTAGAVLGTIVLMAIVPTSNVGRCNRRAFRFRFRALGVACGPAFLPGPDVAAVAQGILQARIRRKFPS